MTMSKVSPSADNLASQPVKKLLIKNQKSPVKNQKSLMKNQKTFAKISKLDFKTEKKQPCKLKIHLHW